MVISLINLFKKKLVELRAPTPFEKKHAVFECPVYLEEQEQWLKKNTMYHELRRPNEVFFIEIPNFWAWADNLDR